MTKNYFFYSIFIFFISISMCNVSSEILEMDYYPFNEPPSDQSKVLFEKSKETSNKENKNEVDEKENISGIILSSPSATFNAGEIKKYKIVNTFEIDLPSNEKELLSYINCFIGKKITKKNIEGLKTALENFYKNSPTPFVLIVAPEQTIKNGYILFYVYESHIDSFNIIGY